MVQKASKMRRSYFEGVGDGGCKQRFSALRAYVGLLLNRDPQLQLRF